MSIFLGNQDADFKANGGTTKENKVKVTIAAFGSIFLYSPFIFFTRYFHTIVVICLDEYN